MRVVGYIRESPDPKEGEPAFAQGEAIRRWTREGGHQLVAVCQDALIPGYALGRDGFRALVGIVERGEADVALVAGLDILSPDKVEQEIAIHELTSRGVTVMSADPDDASLLDTMTDDRLRIITRDVLAKAARLRGDIDEPEPTRDQDDDGADEPDETEPDSDVIVELIPPDDRAESSVS